MPTVEEILIELSARNDTASAFGEVDRGMAGVEAKAAELAAAFADIERSSGAADGALGRAADTTARLASGMRDLQTGASALSFDGPVRGVQAFADGALVAEANARKLIAAMGDLTLVGRAAAGGAFAVGAPTPGRGARTAFADAEQAALAARLGRAGGVLGAGLAESTGLGGRVLNSALGPEGLAVGGLLYGGYKAAQASNDFYSSLAGLAAATGTPYGAVAPIGRSALAAGASGTSQFSDEQLVGGGQQFLAAGVDPRTYAQIAPYEAQGAALLGSLPGGQDPGAVFKNLEATVTDLANTYGQGKDTSIRAFKAFTDLTVAADQFAKADPGALAGNVAKVLPIGAQAGVSISEQLAAIIAETHTGESTRFSATDLAAIERALIKPTAQQEQAAAKLGVEIGPNALKDYGGLTGFFSALGTAGKGDQTDLAKLAGTTNAFRGIEEILGQMRTGGYQRFESGLASSEGKIPGEFKDLLATSPDAQWKGAFNEFKTDMIGAGKVLTDTFQPALLSLALGALGAAKSLGDIAGKGGNWLDDAATWLRGGNGAGVDLNNVGGSDLRRAASWLTDGLVPGSSGAVQATARPASPPPPARLDVGGYGGYFDGFYAQYAARHHLTAGQQGAGGAGIVATGFGPRPEQEPPSGGFFGDATAGDRAAGLASTARLDAVQQAKQAIAALAPDAAAAAKAHDDLANKIAAGLPTDNVVRQLAVYEHALQQLAADVGNLPAGLKLPGVPSATAIAAEETTAQRGVGQYGYIGAKGTFDAARQEYQAGQIDLPTFQAALQGVLSAIPGLGKNPAETRYLEYSVASQAEKAIGSVGRRDALLSDQRATQFDALNLHDADTAGKLPPILAAVEQQRRDQLATAALQDRGDAGALALDRRRINQDAGDLTAAARTADAQRVAADNLQAAQIQLQASQQGGQSAEKQLAAAQGVYAAQVATDAAIKDPAARRNADASARVALDSSSHAILGQTANDNLQAAQLQLQAAQQGYNNSQQQIAAAQAIYQAQLIVNKGITDPAAHANADQAAKIARDSTDHAALSAAAQKRLADLGAEQTYDRQHGIGTADVNKRIEAERARDATLLGLGKYDLLNAAFSDQQAATPKAAPTFASYPGGDPGISAGRGGAVFRFGQFAGDSEAQTIAILRQQVERLEQQLAEERLQSGYQKQLVANTRPGGGGGLHRQTGNRG